MILPNYERSVVNVAASMIAAFGGKPLHKTLEELEFLRSCSKAVLLSLDGLDCEFLQKYGQGPKCVAKITSTFPATTGAAQTVLETGEWRPCSTRLPVGILEYVILRNLVRFRGHCFLNRGGGCKFAAAGIDF